MLENVHFQTYADRTGDHGLYADELRRFREAALEGLLNSGKKGFQKRLPSLYLYDERGSELFERICELPEYYLTRAESTILTAHAQEIADLLGDECTLLEYGSGSSVKTELLLSSLNRPARYVPIDISQRELETAAQRLSEKFPTLEIEPILADYTSRFEIRNLHAARNVAAFFPGSTIGNFEPANAIEFLSIIRRTAGPGSLLLLGVDLKKDPAILHAAYNDAAGITAEFNRNVLHRLNNELGADFVPELFAHYAPYNLQAGCIEMHLVSRNNQEAHIAGWQIKFEKGESILTERSFKYTLPQIVKLSQQSGYEEQKTWIDGRGLFAVLCLRAIN